MGKTILTTTELVKNFNIKGKVDDFIKCCNTTPYMVIIMTDEDESTKIYVKTIQKKLKDNGMICEVFSYEKKTNYKTIISKIKELNDCEEINGILLTMPIGLINLKKNEEHSIINSIRPNKDVDGLTDVMSGRVCTNYLENAIIPSTAKAILYIFDYIEQNFDFKLKGKTIGVVGRSSQVGVPTANLLRHRDATVTIYHSKSEKLEEELKSKDAIVIAIGKKRFLKECHVRHDSIVIDCGINSIEENGKFSICGDADEKNINCSIITPVPRGVGPSLMTSTFLLIFLPITFLSINSLSIQKIDLAVVVCGDRTNETIVLLKSVLMFSTKTESVIFHIVAEKELQENLKTKIEKDLTDFKGKFTFEIYDLTFPKIDNIEWKSLFKTCASQRLFLPNLFSDIDEVIYVDTDILFLSDINELYKLSKQMNDTHLALLASEHVHDANSWYKRFARHPYFGNWGLNSGVMYMNLKKMRKVKFSEAMIPLRNKYQYNITWGDQCLLNIYFYYHPDQLKEIDVQWNYRSDICLFENERKSAKVKILHGNRRSFQLDSRYPLLRAIYLLIETFDYKKYGQNFHQTFFDALNKIIKASPMVNESPCGRIADKVFLPDNLRTLLSNDLVKRIRNELEYEYVIAVREKKKNEDDASEMRRNELKKNNEICYILIVDRSTTVEYQLELFILSIIASNEKYIDETEDRSSIINMILSRTLYEEELFKYQINIHLISTQTQLKSYIYDVEGLSSDDINETNQPINFNDNNRLIILKLQKLKILQIYWQLTYHLGEPVHSKLSENVNPKTVDVPSVVQQHLLFHSHERLKDQRCIVQNINIIPIDYEFSSSLHFAKQFLFRQHFGENNQCILSENKEIFLKDYQNPKNGKFKTIKLTIPNSLFYVVDINLANKYNLIQHFFNTLHETRQKIFQSSKSIKMKVHLMLNDFFRHLPKRMIATLPQNISVEQLNEEWNEESNNIPSFIELNKNLVKTNFVREFAEIFKKIIFKKKIVLDDQSNDSKIGKLFKMMKRIYKIEEVKDEL
ncbi:hypothetical protein SNEBB_011355 [Seison nebaliae]|nr:hypothetical protein SNEBB_011355 [Seison nebaliae]